LAVLLDVVNQSANPGLGPIVARRMHGSSAQNLHATRNKQLGITVKNAVNTKTGPLNRVQRCAESERVDAQHVCNVAQRVLTRNLRRV
jgi:hypothetical protein